MPEQPVQEPVALLSRIQRMSTHDGPGLRTTVFLKGCPLACAWCHNPETIPVRPHLQWQASRCLRCGRCAGVCVHQALHPTAGGIGFDHDRCLACGRCEAACPSGAIERIGISMTVSAVMDLVRRDAVFYRASSGGVTVSGGEPLLQAGFVRALFTRCRAEGIGTVLDTSGAVAWEVLEPLLPLVDLILYDLKCADPLRHRALTGVDPRLILENLRRIHDRRQGASSLPDLWLRTPLVPGLNDTAPAIAAAADLIRSCCPQGISRWELCTFNPLAVAKYQAMGRSWDYGGKAGPTRQAVSELHQAAAAALGDPALVQVV